jgi:hypothetical protein
LRPYCQQDGDRRGNRQEPQTQPRQVGDAEKNREQGHRRAEIGLLDDQREQHQHEHPGDDEIRSVAGAATVLAEVHRENQREGHAREF